MKKISIFTTQVHELNPGFTLVEMLIYISLMSLVMTLVFNQSLDFVRVSSRIDSYVYENMH